MLDQAGDVIMSWDSNQLLKVRHPECAAELESGENGPAAAEARKYLGPARGSTA